jgi:uncharacterized integral membrane protein
MNLIRRILLLLLLLALAVLTFQNQNAFGMPVEFSFLHWSFSLILGFWILFAFAAGVALFALVDTWRGLLLRLEIRRKDQEIARLKQEASGWKETPSDSGGPDGA